MKYSAFVYLTHKKAAQSSPSLSSKIHRSHPDGKQYPIASILGTVNNQVGPSLNGSVILLGSTAIQCNDNLAITPRSYKRHTRNNLR